MLTKEELLQKGISEEVADEIIASSAEPTKKDNLSALQKALDKGSSDTKDDLKKAEGEGKTKDDDDDDNFDEKFMKKMKKYMKTNTKSCQEMMKDMGAYKDKMSKAVEDFDLDSDGAVVEMKDLKPFLDATEEVFGGMAKAISSLNEKIEAIPGLITEKNDKSYDLLKKAAAVQIEQAEGLKSYFSTSQGRKGVTTVAGMAKANEVSTEDNKSVYKKLAKAMKDGSQMAGQLLSVFESRGKNFNRLTDPQKQAVKNIIAEKEAI